MSEARGTGARFESHLAQINLNGARLGYLLSAVLMPAGFALDVAMAPGHVGQFFLIRCIAGAVALGLLAVSYLPWAMRHPVVLGAGPPFVCAAGIEAMILRLDGVVSPYYAGLNLCILAVGVLYTWQWRHALAVSGGIVTLWLLPAIPPALAGTLEVRPFFNNVYFLSLTTVISVASTVIRFRSAEREFAARQEVESTSRELAGTLERLREVDRLKSEFFANISHELRTPLTLILSPVEDLLGTPGRPERERAALAVVRRNAQRLLRLIDDLLDLARLEAGGLRLRVAEVDLVDLAHRVVENARPTAAQRNLDLVLTLDAESTPELHADPHRMEIVVTNLVSNALKFTPDGGRVEVTIGMDDSHVRLLVRDTGPGIGAEHQAKIFERFYQVEGSERRRHGGAGIGLALARELAQLHGGDLSVESTAGHGATFILTLPLGPGHFAEGALERRRVASEEHPGRRVTDRGSEAPPAPEHKPVLGRSEPPIRLDAGRRARIVVAEDEPDLREFIAASLRDEFEVMLAADGAEALTMVRATRPDLVLTDVMMPEVSGTDLCRSIKADSALRTIPVIMLTARSGSDSTLEAYSAGADDFVTKPFHTRVLIARISAQLRLRAMGLQLANQARLTTAGSLAAGIAHEVKNPIGAVLNAAKLLARPESGKMPKERLLTVIQEGAARVVDIISALEDNVRPAEHDGVSTCSVDEGLESSLRLLAHKMDGIQVHRNYAAQRMVVASARQLNQVFLNLLDNAGRAGPANIWVRTEDCTTGGVTISVEDDGEGVPEDVAALLFEPFFTTRSGNGGTGLGLYLCQRIIDDAGGSLRYEPRPGGGARFVIELPALEAAA
ncbi:MAG: ATP-binding protein [Polyangiaceae bacterium]